jgi:glycosyltransferase involved in cell wall biosynthesis
MAEVKRVLHVMRSPVGGLFRHVCDVVREQAESGMEVGVICDSNTGGDNAAQTLAGLAPHCKLGIHRFAMPRLPGPGDVANLKSVSDIAQKSKAQILHGHGAKGGFYARVAARRIGVKSAYTPHGGSLHYNWLSSTGWIFLGMEWLLGRIGGNNIFVCEFERSLYERKIGKAAGKSIVVHNGLTAEDFQMIEPNPDAADFLFVGEMRLLKGVDVLLKAMADLPEVSLALVGAGPDVDKFKALSAELVLGERVKFLGAMPMRQALSKGRILVVPSRNESYPYVVLEAAAAGRVVLASEVGGIPEILPQGLLFQPGSTGAVLSKLREATQNANYFNNLQHATRAALQQNNTTAAMSHAIHEFYAIL